jgi:hypothetical protein
LIHNQGKTPLYSIPDFKTGQTIFNGAKYGTHIIGKTPNGRATVIALQLNNQVAITVRRNWVVAGWHPPKEID